MPHRATWGRPRLVRRQRCEKGEHGPESLLGFLWAGMDEWTRQSKFPKRGIDGLNDL